VFVALVNHQAMRMRRIMESSVV